MRRSEVVTARRPHVRMIFLKAANSRGSLAATRTSEEKILSIGFTGTLNGRRWAESWTCAQIAAQWASVRRRRHALCVARGSRAWGAWALPRPSSAMSMRAPVICSTRTPRSSAGSAVSCHRVTGRLGNVNQHKGIGWDCLHVAVDGRRGTPPPPGRSSRPDAGASPLRRPGRGHAASDHNSLAGLLSSGKAAGSAAS